MQFISGFQFGGHWTFFFFFTFSFLFSVFLNRKWFTFFKDKKKKGKDMERKAIHLNQNRMNMNKLIIDINLFAALENLQYIFPIIAIMFCFGRFSVEKTHHANLCGWYWRAFLRYQAFPSISRYKIGVKSNKI